MHLSVNRSILLPNICIEFNNAYADNGIITFSSSSPACAHIVIVVSFPITWKPTISSISAIDGLTFPGIIEEPGWIGGKTISLKPVAGPEFNSLKSLANFIKLTARTFNTELVYVIASMFCVASKRFLLDLNRYFVSLLISLIIFLR